MDAVRQVIRIEKEVIEPPPPQATSVDSLYLRGVAKLEDRLLTLLDLENLLEETDLSKSVAMQEVAPVQ